MSDTCILWFRKDLRLDDNPALIKAAKHKIIIPLFIFDRNLEEYNKIGEASHWWLEKSLISLSKDLNQKFNVLEGDSLEIITNIIKEEKVNYILLGSSPGHPEPPRVPNAATMTIPLRPRC